MIAPLQCGYRQYIDQNHVTSLIKENISNIKALILLGAAAADGQ
jgi:hypothetical protein